MKECLRCGGSAYRDFAYGCDHQFWDDVIPEPWVLQGHGMMRERLFEAGGAVAGQWLTVHHPTREGARQLWREQYAIGLMVDSLFRKLTGWAKEGAELRRRRAATAQAVWVRVAEEMDQEHSPLGIVSDRGLFMSLVETFVPGDVGVSMPDGFGVGMVHQVEVRDGAWGAELWALIDGVSREANAFAVIELDPPRLRSVEANERVGESAADQYGELGRRVVAFDPRKLDVRMGSFSYGAVAAPQKSDRLERLRQALEEHASLGVQLAPVSHAHAMSGTPKVPAGWPDHRTDEERAAAALVGRAWMCSGVEWTVTRHGNDRRNVRVVFYDREHDLSSSADYRPEDLLRMVEACGAVEVTSE